MEKLIKEVSLIEMQKDQYENLVRVNEEELKLDLEFQEEFGFAFEEFEVHVSRDKFSEKEIQKRIIEESSMHLIGFDLKLDQVKVGKVLGEELNQGNKFIDFQQKHSDVFHYKVMEIQDNPNRLKVVVGTSYEKVEVLGPILFSSRGIFSKKYSGYSGFNDHLIQKQHIVRRNGFKMVDFDEEDISKLLSNRNRYQCDVVGSVFLGNIEEIKDLVSNDDVKLVYIFGGEN